MPDNAITEQILVDVVRVMHNRIATMTMNERSSTIEHGVAPSVVYRSLLFRYPLSVLEAAIKWLELGNYVGTPAGA